MKKRRSKLESTRKTEQDWPVKNFDLWSKVNAKSQSQLSRVKVNGYWFGFLGQFTDRQ